MQKKRRKLNKDFEKVINSAKKKIELILAKIFDINDEDIQKEYMASFSSVVKLYELIKNNYDLTGFNEHSEDLMRNFNEAFSKFELEHEI